MQTTTLKGFRLSFQQERLWRLAQRNQIGYSQCAIKLEGALDPGRFQQALQEVADNYEILHTTFYTTPGMEIPIQVLSNNHTIFCLFLNIEHLEAARQQNVLEDQWQELSRYSFDLEHGPQLHAVIIRTAAQEHMLLLSLPALCADTFTLKLLIPLLLQTYAACLAGKTLLFDDGELQYVDVSSWQYNLLQDADAEQQLAFWHKFKLSQLSSMPVPFQHDKRNNQDRGKASSLQPQQVEVQLDAALQHQLIRLSQLYQVSIEACLLTCWQILLWRLTDETPLIGLICDGRPYEELTMVLGPNSWTVPFAPGTLFSNQLTFEWVLKQTQQALQEAVEKQLYFTWEALPPQRPWQECVFPIGFSASAWPAQWHVGSLVARLQQQHSGSEPSSLHLHLTQIGERIQLHLFTQHGAFSFAQAQSIADLLYALIQSALATPERAVSQLLLLSPANQALQRERWRGVERNMPFEPWHRLVAAQAQRQPQAPALRSGDQLWSYQQVEQQANQLAHRLRERGLRPGGRVALWLPRDGWAIIALLAVLKAGGSYVPLEEQWPVARIQGLVQNLAPTLLLTTRELGDQLAENSLPLLLLDEERGRLGAFPQSAPEVEVGPEEVAYVMYTSGSSGTPKGVLVRQGSVSNYTQALCEELRVQAGWHYATVSSLAADLGNTMIFCGLASGGCVHVLPYEQVTDASAFASYVRTHPLDVLKIVPTHLQALLAVGAGEVVPRERLLLGGEALPWSLVQQVQVVGSTCELYNHYGPTETTIGALVNRLGPIQEIVVPPVEQRGSSVPLGQPIANVQIAIWDHEEQRVPRGVSGELVIAGAGVAAGYLAAQEQTSERFREREEGGERQRWYRTGDVVRENEQGEIEFLGRRDGQVKLRGHRIELGEIEEELRRHAGVHEAAVQVWREEEEEEALSELVGYIVGWKQPGPGEEEVRAALAQRLPAYEVPTRIVCLEQLPRTSNGKLDRKRLPPPPARGEAKGQAEIEEGRTPVEELLLQVWQAVLGISGIGRTGDFFRLGGHSLLGTQLVARLRSIFGIEVPITWLFETPTVVGLARRLEVALSQEQEQESTPSLAPVSREQPLPLSFAQQRLWFLDQLEPGSNAYNIPRTMRLRGHLDVSALGQALRTIIMRHENLRTIFPSQQGEPVQQISLEPLSQLVLLDLRQLAEQEREAEGHRIAQQEVERPFDLACGPLLRCYLLLLGEQDQVLLLTMHHIISDGWSGGIFIRELSSLYAALQRGEEAELPALSVQYADYALWQRSWLQGEVLERQLDYWRKQLSGLVPLELPTDRPRPALQTFRGAQQRMWLPAELSQQLHVLSRQEEVTLFMTLLAAFQVLLTRYSGQQDIVVGTPIANRTREEIEGLIGCFVNTLVLRTDLSGNPTFQELLKRVRAMALGAYTHQDIPFEQVVEMLHPERDRSRSPLFQVIFALQNISEVEVVAQESTVEMESFAIEQRTAKFELSMGIVASEQRLGVTLEYNTDLFEETTIKRFLGHFQFLLEGIVRAPAEQIMALPLLSQREYGQILTAWNQTEKDYPQKHYLLHQLFEQQVEQTPDAVALVFEDEQLTYQVLNQRANQLAYVLQQSGVGPDVLVGVCMERSLDLVIALLASQKAGGAYVPLDPGYPQERLAYILQDAQVHVLLTHKALQERCSQGKILSLLCLDAAWPVLLVGSTSNLRSAAQPEHLAYMIYTSGSTGRPKGAMNTHQGICNRLLWMQERYCLTAADRVLQKTPYSFDVSVWEFFWPLLTGASLLLAIPGGHQDPMYLKTVIGERAITTLHFVPAMLQAFLEGEKHGELSSLRQVMCSGEALSMELQECFFASLPQGVSLHNLYGPTEASVDVTFWECQPGSERGTVPIGRPIANTHVYVLDECLQPVPVGVAGELYIGGVGLARGYWQQASLTAERFLPDAVSQIAGARLYKTGDRVRYRQDGNIEYLGRLDEQVKLRGYRIELGEIEATLYEHPQVKQSVVVLQGIDMQDKRLIAYIVRGSGADDSVGLRGELTRYLKEKLPEYMIPARFEMIDALPLLPNGKVNRKALPSPRWEERKEKEGEGTREESPVEELVRQVWQQVLRREQIGAQENFFDIGGHSLLATQIIARLRAIMGVELSLRMFFEAPSLGGLAQRIQQQMLQDQGIEIPMLKPVSREQFLPLSFAQQRLWFLHQLSPQSTAYTIPNAVRLQGDLATSALRRSIFALVQRHESLRTTFAEEDGQVMQRIETETCVTFPLIDLSAYQGWQREEQVQRLVQEEAELPFDLVQGPLLRCWLLRLSEREHVLLLAMHHIVSDGWSMGLLVQELTSLYRAFRAGDASPLAPLPIQYADYAYWQRQWLQGEVLKEHIRYWTNQLSEAQALELPTDYPRPLLLSHQGARYGFRLGMELSQALRELSRKEGMTLFMTLLAAFQVLLARLSGVQDIVVGTDSANRSQVETEGLIGFFVNLLALRTTFHDNPRFLRVLQEVREMMLGVYAHQELPFEMIIEHLKLRRQGKRTPLVNVLFVMQNIPHTEAEFPDVVVQSVQRDATSAKFELALFMAEGPQGISGSVVYSTDLFKRETIDILMQRYEALLCSIVAQPAARIANLEIATENEKAQKARQQVALHQNLKGIRGGRQKISGKDEYRPAQDPE